MVCLSEFFTSNFTGYAQPTKELTKPTRFARTCLPTYVNLVQGMPQSVFQGSLRPLPSTSPRNQWKDQQSQLDSQEPASQPKTTT